MEPSTSAEKTQTFLFGTAIRNSLSPAFHNACYKARGVDWSLARIDSSDMEAFLTKIDALGPAFGGSAVTMPHKAAILRHVDHIDPQAKVIGAANTLYFRRDGDKKALVATNTDVAGIRDSIRAALPRDATGEPSLPPRRVGVIVGGGGTTRTAVYTLRYELQCEQIYIINRLDDEVSAIIDDFAAQGITDVFPLKSAEDVGRLKDVPCFVVNAIPCFEPTTPGEKSARAALLAVFDLCKRRLGTADSAKTAPVFLEMCYFPRPWTPVCDFAQEAGLTVVQGMEAMYHQAVAQQLLWLGEPSAGLNLLDIGRQGAADETARRQQGAEPL
ncbi:unnamed protein product [Parajaminaea phylloscopi]